jgi:hypothetical protein
MPYGVGMLSCTGAPESASTAWLMEPPTTSTDQGGGEEHEWW